MLMMKIGSCAPVVRWGIANIVHCSYVFRTEGEYINFTELTEH